MMETEDVGEVWGVGGRFGGDGGRRLVFGWFLECQIVVHAGEEINFRSSINLVQIQLELCILHNFRNVRQVLEDQYAGKVKSEHQVPEDWHVESVL